MLLSFTDTILKNRFYLFLFLLTFLSFLVRLYNITYSSFWSDELYSMLSVHPDNSLYEVLYMQRKDQPPLYFILLRFWTILFGFTDLSARLLSVIIGTLSVFAIGVTGRFLFNFKIGLLTSFITAFSFAQIEHSLEARFYGLLFLLVTCSLYTYWLLLTTKYKFVLHLLHGVLCGAIVLTHHFGALIVLSYFLFDLLYLFQHNFKRSLLFEKLIIWTSLFMVVVPWLFFVYQTVKTVKDYWLKTINITDYLFYNLQYSNWILAIILFTCIVGFLFVNFKNKIFLQLLITQFILVLLIPIFFSYFIFPILVPRYSFAMGPTLYLLISFGILSFVEKIKKYRLFFLFLIFIIFSFDGIKASFINKKPLMKEPWREMAQWLRTQSDFAATPIYSVGYPLNGRFTIDYYLPDKKVIHILYDSIGLSKHKKFYLIETNQHDVVPAYHKLYLKSHFYSTEIPIGLDDIGKGGKITVFNTR